MRTRKQKQKLASPKANSLYNDHFLSNNQLEDAELSVVSAQKKIDGVMEQIAETDKQIAELPSTEELELEYKRALAQEEQQRKRAASQRKRPPPACHNWMIEADRRKSLGGQTLNYKFVCGTHHQGP